MPLIMDNAVPMDMEEDLFGESVGLLPMRPQSKHIRQRLDEMRTRGCCQSVAWSRTGTIASITANGQELQLRHLRAHPDDGTWDLSEPTVCKLVQGTPAIPLVHLEWAATNSPELAIFDDVGRVAVISFTIALNHPFVIRTWDSDLIDNTNAAAGCYWLPVVPPQPQKPFNILHGPATKVGSAYQYASSFVHLTGPCHPHASKSALLSVTTGGTLKLFCPQNNNQFQDTSKELESVHHANDLITHAAFASEKTHLLVAIATSTKHLRLHKVDIQWGNLPAQNEKGAVPASSRLNPSLSSKQLATTSWFQNSSSPASIDPSETDLCQLTVLPSLLDPSGSNTAPAVVLALTCSLPPQGSFQDGQSIIERWEAIEQRQSIASAFEQLGNRRNSVSTPDMPTVTKLRRLEPITFDKTIIRLQTMHFGKTVILNFADGTVEYRDRFTFEEIYSEENLNQIMHLRQVGWNFSSADSCQQVAFSPTYCSMIQLGDDRKLKWVKLQHLSGDIGESMQDATYSACIAGLSVSAAAGMWYQSNIDDVLAIAQQYTGKRKFAVDMLQELIKILKVQVDYTEDQPNDNIMRNHTLHTCMSMLQSLGFRGRLKRLSFCGKMAFINLNIRNSILLTTMAMNSPPPLRERMNPLDEHEVVSVLAEGARWALELMAVLSDSLFALSRDPEFMDLVENQRPVDMQTYLLDRNEVSLHMVLCSSSRTLLTALCRRVVGIEALATKAHNHYQQNRAAAVGRPSMLKLHEAYAEMDKIMRSSLIDVKAFEKMLNVIGTDLRAAYGEFLPRVVLNTPNPPQGKEVDNRVKSAQSQCELSLLSCAPPMQALFPTLNKFFKQDLQSYKKQTKQEDLFFAEYKIVDILDDPHSLLTKASTGSHIDVFRRVQLGPKPEDGRQWRRCTRCASVMEDVVGGRVSGGLTFLLNQQRKCSCGGFWTLLPPGKSTV